MNVRYTEGPESLVIATIGVEVKRGETVEVPAEVGEKLVDQGWETRKITTKKKETK